MFWAPSDSRWSPAPQTTKYIAHPNTFMLQGFLALALITAHYAQPQKSKSNGLSVYIMISGFENVYFYWKQLLINSGKVYFH